MIDLNKSSIEKINTLISEGFECMLHFGDQSWQDKSLTSPCWNVDFTRKIEPDSDENNYMGIWDNHEDGYSININDAVDIAYNNIRQGRRLK